MDFCRQVNIISKVMNSHRQEDKMRRWNIITEEMVSFDYKPQEYLRHYIAPQYPFFEMTKEGMKLLMDYASDKFMYKFVDGEHLHEYVNMEILNEESKRAYDKVLQEDKSAIIKYALRDV